jgi:hypothetical protein
LSAAELLGKNRRRLLKRMQSGQLDFLKEGGHCSQLAWARSGFYDDLRKFATFLDEKPPLPQELFQDLGEGLVSDLYAFYDEALKLIKKGPVMELAAQIYSNNLGRL